MGTLKRCEFCRHWKYEPTSPIDMSHCRRRAPLVTGGMMSDVQTVWPRVTKNDWCGEWEQQ